MKGKDRIMVKVQEWVSKFKVKKEVDVVVVVLEEMEE